MEIKDRTIALLIDSDNVSSDYFSIILDELSQYGKVTYRRLYGDFTNNKANGWKPALLEYSIEQIQQVAFTSGKNATDSKMIIDAMDILYKGNVDCFCLATSDSDFTNLAMRFRNDNIVVIGAGEKKTPLSFRRACDIFIPIDEILSAAKAAKKAAAEEGTKKKGRPKKSAEPPKTTAEKRLEDLVNVADDIIASGADLDGWMNFSIFINELRRKENDFNPKLYGFTNSRPIQFFKSIEKDGKPVFLLEKSDKADKIKITPEQCRIV